MGGVLFDGKTVIRPQARVRVDAQGLTPTVLGSANVLMAFGSAAGGEPKKVLSFTSPRDAVSVLRSGAVLDAINKAWDASKELPGASTIQVVRIDPALKSSLGLAGSGQTFASLALLDGTAVLLATLTALVSGVGGNSILVTIGAGSVSGKKITLVGGVTTEVYDNLATVADAVAAIQGISNLVGITFASEGTFALITGVPLAGGITVANVITLTSKDWGAHTLNIEVKVEAGTSTGKKITIQKTDDSITEVFDNLADVAAAVAAINNSVSGSVLVDATLLLAGTLSNMAYTALTGGIDGSPTNTDWSDGFILMDTTPGDVYLAATSDASVHSLMNAQIALTSQSKYPGLSVLGHALGETDAQVIARAQVYASDKTGVVVCTPGQKDFDANGNVVTLASYQSTAPRVAGLICGLPIKGSPTYKTLSGLGLEKDWTSAQLDIFEQSGILSLENIPNRGLRITHGQTTYMIDGNAAYREISTVRIRNLISITLKQELEKFVGEPGTKFTIAAIKAKVESVMIEALNAELITDGVDDAGQPQPAYGNIIVKFNSATGICYVEVECSPVTTVNFVLATAHFRATNIVA